MTGFAIDHRKVVRGSVFGAFKGAVFNGEDFISDAVDRGAVAVVAGPDAVNDRVPLLTDPEPRRLFAELAAKYYGQRASVGLIIAEGTQPSDDGQGYLTTPGIYTPSHIAGWKPVTSGRAADATAAGAAGTCSLTTYVAFVVDPSQPVCLAMPSAAAAPRTAAATATVSDRTSTTRSL